MKLRDLVFACALLALPRVSFADDLAAPPAQAPAPAVNTQGILVLGVGDSADATWPLAQAVYGSEALRPATLDEPRARALAGEPPAADAPKDVRELAELRAAVHGDDAASQLILRGLLDRLHVANLLVLTVADAGPSARLFSASGGFDSATYAPDAGTGNVRAWSGTVRTLSRFLTGAAPATPVTSTTAPQLAPVPPPVAPKPEPKTASKPFYTSPWFWGAIGAAAFGGLAVFLVTRDTSDGQIHLRAQVPQ